MAFNYAYHYRGYVFGLRTGYRREPELAGAGSVLQARMIADCFARGDTHYDLGADYLDCKRYWLNRVETSRGWAWHSPRAPRPTIASQTRTRRLAPGPSRAAERSHGRTSPGVLVLVHG